MAAAVSALPASVSTLPLCVEPVVAMNPTRIDALLGNEKIDLDELSTAVMVGLGMDFLSVFFVIFYVFFFFPLRFILVSLP